MAPYQINYIANSDRKILIVDDESTNLELLEAILRPENYNILRAQSGLEALDLTKEITPDLIIMDVCMPEMSGFEACKGIKEKSTDRFIPVMLLTNLDATESKVQGLDAGADEYMIKPPSRAETISPCEGVVAYSRPIVSPD